MVVFGNLKQEYLNRLWSSLAVNVLIMDSFHNLLYITKSHCILQAYGIINMFSVSTTLCKHNNVFDLVSNSIFFSYF
jgi:hypothetical protein